MLTSSRMTQMGNFANQGHTEDGMMMMTRMGFRTWAAMLALGVAAIAGPAEATQIGFAPGASVAGSQTNIYDAGTDLDSLIVTSVFNWSSRNNTVFPGAGPFPAGLTSPQSWFLRIFSADGAASADDTFTETFTFSLRSTRSDITDSGQGTGTTAVYGSDITFQSHVFMTLAATGTITPDTGDLTYDQDTRFGLKYSTFDFTMRFDEDGKQDGTSTTLPVTIATFGDTGAGSATVFTPDISGTIRADLQWTVSWDEAFAGVFELGGSDVVTSGSGLQPISVPLLKLTQQDVTRTFRPAANCGVVAACYELQSDGATTGTSFFVPEPMTMSLLGFGLIGLAVAARRRR